MKTVYRIYDTRLFGNHWVQEESSRNGDFLYQTVYERAQVFATETDAQDAIDRWTAAHPWFGQSKEGPLHPFQIRKSYVEEPRTEYIRTDAKPQGYLFVGGPLDGKRFAVAAGSYQYYAQVPRLPRIWPAANAPLDEDISLSISIDTAVYLRERIVAAIDYQHPTQQHEVFVYAGTKRSRPLVGEFIMFRDRNYKIVMSTSTVTRAERVDIGGLGMQKKTTTISLLASALQYDFAWNAWTPNIGAEISVLEASTAVAP